MVCDSGLESDRKTAVVSIKHGHPLVYQDTYRATGFLGHNVSGGRGMGDKKTLKTYPNDQIQSHFLHKTSNSIAFIAIYYTLWMLHS